MSNDERPSWTRTATRLVERPKIDVWYKPDDLPVEGYLVWRGDDENRVTGDSGYLYAIRTEDGRTVGVRERAKLIGLRSVKLNSRVYIRCVGRVPLENGRTLLDFEVYVDEKTKAPIPVATASGANGAGSADPIPF